MFVDAVQLVQWVESDSPKVLLFKVVDMCPSGKSFREGPAVNSEADTSQDGYTRVVRAPESGGKRVDVVERRGRRSQGGWESGFSNVRRWREISSRGE